VAENKTEKKTESTEKKTVAERVADLTDRAAGLSDEVLKSVESGQRAAIDAVRKFVGTVDESMPAHGGDHPSRRNTIVDAALDMADKLVKAQYEFIRSAVSNANETLHKQGDAKPPGD
jgi:vacuolar-type H+-ATPase subunit E/Vma4